MSWSFSATIAAGKALANRALEKVLFERKRKAIVLKTIVSKLEAMEQTKSRPFRREAILYAYKHRDCFNCEGSAIWLKNAKDYNDRDPMNWYGERPEDMKVLTELIMKARDRLSELGEH